MNDADSPPYQFFERQDQPPFRLLRGRTGRAILRPWFDRVALGAITRWYLPLSRAWAAGLAARGSVDAFAQSLGPAAAKWRNGAVVLLECDEARRRYEAAAARWEASFFGGEGKAADLAAIESERFAASTRLMAMRSRFLALRRVVPQVSWQIAGPEMVQQMQGGRLADIASAFAPPSPLPAITRSRALERAGRHEIWLRMTSPGTSTGDIAWARVFRPASGPVQGAVVSLHGILMEQDMWGIADPVTDLVTRGFLVIRPEGPWHGRRRPAGAFGGEPIIARGLLGFIELFEAWVPECAAWIAWARQESGGPVALAGISLGALASQIVLSICGGWSAATRPDAALLITTTGDIVDGALRGSLATSLAMSPRLAEAGWSPPEIRRWRGLVEPAAGPGIDPSRIVMLLGDVDTVTPYDGGKELAARWGLPPANVFVRHGGHFSAALSLYHDPAPMERVAAVLLGGA